MSFSFLVVTFRQYFELSQIQQEERPVATSADVCWCHEPFERSERNSWLIVIHWHTAADVTNPYCLGWSYWLVEDVFLGCTWGPMWGIQTSRLASLSAAPWTVDVEETPGGVSWVESRAMRLLKSLVRGVYCNLEKWNMSWIFENESIQISNSLYMNSIKLERSN